MKVVKDESLEEKIARIDTNVAILLNSLPMVQKHDRELFALKIIIGPIIPIAMFWLAHKAGVQIF